MNLAKLRLKNKLTQAQLAEKLGVDASTVTKWETDASMPRAATLKKLAEVLDCTIDELVGR